MWPLEKSWDFLDLPIDVTVTLDITVAPMAFALPLCHAINCLWRMDIFYIFIWLEQSFWISLKVLMTLKQFFSLSFTHTHTLIFIGKIQIKDFLPRRSFCAKDGKETSEDTNVRFCQALWLVNQADPTLQELSRHLLTTNLKRIALKKWLRNPRTADFEYFRQLAWVRP